jgi:hypothetical protein
MARKGSASHRSDNPMRRLVQPIEERMDALDAAIRDIHPDYAERVLSRMAELESTTRQHANKVFQVLHNQTTAMEASVAKAETAAHRVSSHLQQAAERHHREAAALRAELGELKKLLDEQSAECQKHSEACRAALESMKTLSAEMDDTFQGRFFQREQSSLIARARGPSQSLVDIISNAQKIAHSRSPSATRREGPGVESPVHGGHSQPRRQHRGRSPGSQQVLSGPSDFCGLQPERCQMAELGYAPQGVQFFQGYAPQAAVESDQVCNIVLSHLGGPGPAGSSAQTPWPAYSNAEPQAQFF